MSETRALVPVGQMTLADTMTLGETLAKSGYFDDAKEAAQAVVKVLAGRELGFDPIASMTGIHIIKRRVTLSANMMAHAVKRSQRYDYRVVELTDNVCEIGFFEGSKHVGTSIFTKDDAQRAGTQNLNKFPRNMLFARAMSNGVKWYCPDVFMTAVYTPDELGAEVDAEGEIIDLVPTTITQPEQDTNGIPPADTTSNGEHWIDKKTRNDKPVRAMFWAWANDTMGLINDDVYAALEVDSIHDYKGTMGDAKTQITAWVKKCDEVAGLEPAAGDGE